MFAGSCGAGGGNGGAGGKGGDGGAKGGVGSAGCADADGDRLHTESSQTQGEPSTHEPCGCRQSEAQPGRQHGGCARPSVITKSLVSMFAPPHESVML